MTTSSSVTAARLKTERLGIFGAGHLGRTLALGLIAAGFPRTRMLLCHGKSSQTREILEELGLAERIVPGDELTRRSSIVLATLRPQDVGALAGCELSANSLLVSFMAGVPLQRLPVGDGTVRRIRVMPSAPYTIAKRNGIAGIFPSGELTVGKICRALAMAPIAVENEDALHAFTALGVCLPIILTYWTSLGRGVDETELFRLAVEHGLPDYPRVLSWARTIQKSTKLRGPIEDFLAASTTRGGVTEAIIETIRAGGSLTEALLVGIRQSRRLTSEEIAAV